MNDIARIAGLLADPARAKMLWSLIDGSARPAGELAYSANVSAQSASGHLAKLVDGGLIEAQAQGRHRYFRIAGAEVAALVEALASLGAGNRPRAPRPPLPSPSVPVQFLHARTCYGHFAGEMAVKLLEAMLKQRWPHLGGALGDALLQLYVTRGWIQRQRRSRVVSITPKGNEAFRRWFGAI